MALVSEYATKLKPLIKRGDGFIEMIPIAGVDPFSGSYFRHHREGDQFFLPEETSMLGEFYTLHTFGASTIFHPSMEEVIAHIPHALLEDIVGFTLEWAAVVPDPLHSQLLEARMHLGMLTIYGYTDVPVEERPVDLIALPHEIRGEAPE